MDTKLNALTPWFTLRRPFKIGLIALMLGLPAMLMSGKAFTYVMPAEQLLHLMGTNFSMFKTLIITQSTHLKQLNRQEAEVILHERIWLQSPGRYYAEIVGMPDGQDPVKDTVTGRKPGGDMSFRRLLMADDLKARTSLLSDLGVDVKQVFLSRFEGIVAYQLGEKGAESPKLVIEKDTFFPLLLCYRYRHHSESRMVTVRFKDYQRLGKGFYPFEIVYSDSGEFIERYTVVDLKVNTPVDQPLSEIVIKRPPPDEVIETHIETPDDKRLKEVIDLLREKYK